MVTLPIESATKSQPAGRAPVGPLRRVAIIGPSGASLRHLRGGLIRAITQGHHSVLCFAPAFEPADVAALEALGAGHRLLPPPSSPLALFAPGRFVTALAAELAAWRPHVVVTYGGELTLETARAARRARAEKIVALINVLPPPSAPARPWRAIARTLELADAAIFHNPEDPVTLRRRGLLPADLGYAIVAGAGVDLVRHSVQPLPPLAGGLAFLMIAPLDTHKGVIDFCEAARTLKQRAPTARFMLAGPPGNGRSGLTVRAIETYRESVTYLGVLEDVRPAIAHCHVYVHASHVEGMPRPVLEAMAAGRPVIATNIAGCRDTVDERVNGCLVPPSDPAALAAAMESFLKRPDLIPAIARASRAKAERRFDESVVHATLLDVLGLAPPAR